MNNSLFTHQENLLPVDGDALIFPAFFNRAASDIYLSALQQEIQWRHEPIRMFGKTVMQPRLTAWYGEAGKPYRYSGITMQPLPWTDQLLYVKQQVEAVSGVQFTSALLNRYRDGKDSMGWHRDNEKELGTNPVIGSVSFGAARKFQFRHYYNKQLTREIDLTHGSYLLMKGTTQHHWEHQLPKTGKVMSERINITFRVLL